MQVTLSGWGFFFLAYFLEMPQIDTNLIVSTPKAPLDSEGRMQEMFLGVSK